MDEERLRSERANRGSWKSRVTGLEDLGAMNAGGSDETPRRKDRRRTTRGEGSTEEDDLEYRLALEASKNAAEEDAARRGNSAPTDTDDDLAKALKLSREEEELRKRQLEDQSQSNLLFDDTPAQEPQPTGFNQGYQQQAAVDWFGNPVAQPQQPQQTGYLNNAYSQPTGYQNGNNFTGANYAAFQQPQPTGFEQPQQQQFIQPQNTYNPWGQQLQQQPTIQEQPTAQPGSNNPWASTQQIGSPMQIQPTGSNNPFATQQPQHHPTPAFAQQKPTLSSLSEQQTATQINARPNPISNFQPAPAQQQQPQRTADPYANKLNALLASGEGQDTFGNTGDMRIPSQHTAPGTFVNSAGAGSMGRLEAAKTGNNPFYSGQQSAAQVQYPAQTGPAGAYGSNPFGARQGQQGGQQGGSLIDL